MFGCILNSVHVQTDCNCVCVYIGMLLCACADCMVGCVHVLAAWFYVCMLTAWLCVLVHPCVPTDCPVHVHMMHACTGWLSHIILLRAYMYVME